MKQLLYFDNAATTMKKPQCVVDAVCEAMQSLGNSGRSAHEGSLAASRVIFEARQAVAELFGCERPDHVVFTANATEALNIAISGLLSPGDHVITTVEEHNSVLRPLYRLQKEGLQVSFLPVDAAGVLQYEKLESLLQSNTKAVICTHASNLTGNVTDLERIGAFAKAHGLLFLVDASQTAGVIAWDMKKTGADVVCFTGHKSLMGPQGTGGLCIRPGVEIRPWCVGGTGVQTYDSAQPMQYPTRLEAGTRNGHGIAGLLAALEFRRSLPEHAYYEHEADLTRRFVEGVRKIPNVRLYGCTDAPLHVGIVSLNIGNLDSGEVADCLFERYGISVRSGAHCAPRLHEALGTKAQGTVRFSFGYYNTEQEVDAAISAIEQIAAP